jgi:hypothetical protein
MDDRTEEEEEKDADGYKNLTNKYLRELIKKNPKKYYRTAYLNDKLFLHYSGFHKMANLE